MPAKNRLEPDLILGGAMTFIVCCHNLEQFNPGIGWNWYRNRCRISPDGKSMTLQASVRAVMFEYWWYLMIIHHEIWNNPSQPPDTRFENSSSLWNQKSKSSGPNPCCFSQMGEASHKDGTYQLQIDSKHMRTHGNHANSKCVRRIDMDRYSRLCILRLHPLDSTSLRLRRGRRRRRSSPSTHGPDRKSLNHLHIYIYILYYIILYILYIIIYSHLAYMYTYNCNV